MEVERKRPPPDPQENAWIEAARNGDRDAFDALVQAHGRHVLRYLKGLSGSGNDAEDLLQDAFCEAYKSIKGFRDGTPFRPWILTIAYRCWVHVRRKKRLPLQGPEALGGIAAVSIAPSSPDLKEAVNNAVAQLPEEQRAVFLLRFGEGLSHAEIAEIVETEEPTVRWRLFRARQTMKKLLKAWSPDAVKKS
jgi:RNA polymerase sigma-70 factor, ECF subfamily